MTANPKYTYLFYSVVAVSLVLIALWPQQDSAGPSRGELNNTDNSQVLIFWRWRNADGRQGHG